LAVVPRDALTLTGHFFTGDAKAARTLRDWLEQRSWPAAKSFKIESPPADVAPADQWVTLQVRGDSEMVRGALSPHAPGKRGN